jgi:hypothetical protein
MTTHDYLPQDTMPIHKTWVWFAAAGERAAGQKFEKLTPRQQLARHRALKEMERNHDAEPK